MNFVEVEWPGYTVLDFWILWTCDLEVPLPTDMQVCIPPNSIITVSVFCQTKIKIIVVNRLTTVDAYMRKSEGPSQKNS